MAHSSPFMQCPSTKENVFLWKGHATFGSEPSEPIMPRLSAICCLCGHRFCEAYHSPRRAKWNSAICSSRYLTQTPPLAGTSSILQARNQVILSFEVTFIIRLFRVLPYC